MVSNIKVLKDNNINKKYAKEKNNITFPLKIHCSECDSELEITEEDTYIGWLGAKYITCPCCGQEAMVDELDGITLTKDNIKFPIHFIRTTKGLRSVIEVDSDEIVKEIQRGITYCRERKSEHYWFTSHGDFFLIIFRYSGDENYFVMVTKDFYETYIPFEQEDYE